MNCEYCENLFSTLKQLHRHHKTDYCKKIQYLLSKQNLNIDKLKSEITELQNNLNEIKKQNIDKDKTIKILEDKSEEYRKIVEKAATKSTKTVNNKNTYNHNNHLNYISQEPIRFSELPKQLKNVVTSNSIMFDENEFHDHVVDNILKDEDGKDKVLCTDINRKNFSYKDETSGQLVSDPELERLREQLKKGSDIKSVKRELLNKLIEKYDGTSIDPYGKFCDILKKLDFGNPFVEHVAKKTYIKTKPNNDNSLTNIEENVDETIEENE